MKNMNESLSADCSLRLSRIEQQLKIEGEVLQEILDVLREEKKDSEVIDLR